MRGKPLVTCVSFIVIALTSAFARSPSAVAQAPLQVSLETSMATAVERHPSVTAAARALDAAQARLVQAKAGVSVQVLLTGRASTGTLTSLGAPTGGPPTSSHDVTVEASLSLYDGGTTALQIQQAQAAVEAVAAALDAARQDAALAAAQAFFQVLRALRLVDVREAAGRSAQRQLQQAEAFVRAGTAARADVVKAQAAVASAEADLVTVRGQVETALATLRGAMGLPLTQALSVVEPGDPVLVTVSPAEASSQATAQRAEVRRVAADVRSAQAALRIAELRAGVQVSVGTSGVVQVSPNPGQAGWSVSATLNLPVADGGRAKAAVEEARANLAAAMARADTVTLQVQLQAFQAAISIRDSAARAEALRVSLAAADESQRVAEGRYAAGVGTLLEALDAQTLATQAGVGTVQARYDLHLATVTLRHAVGLALVARRS